MEDTTENKMTTMDDLNERCVRLSSSPPRLRTAALFTTILCVLVSARPWWSQSRRFFLNRAEYASGKDLQLVDTSNSFITAPQRSFGPTASSPQQRRSLSTSNRNHCQPIPQVKQRPILPIPLTYYATYPSSGSRITGQLIEALTGLRVQREHGQILRKDAVAVQTRYPHKSGLLAEWDRFINRVIILIRNPLYAFPSLFDKLYASEKHLPVNFHPQQRGAVEGDASGEWISWRDRMFESQMLAYQDFIRYWTKRYEHNNRLFISYEGLMTDDEATRLAIFLGKLNEVPTVKLDDVPCVWETVWLLPLQGRRRLRSINEVETSKNDPDERWNHRQLSSYFIPHPSSIDATPGSRPFTTEQLKAMAHAIEQVKNELYTHSNYLKGILTGYRREITAELLKRQDADDAKIVELGTQRRAPETRTFHIFLVSPPGTESEVVTNWMMGLFEPEQNPTKLITSPGMRVYQLGEEVPITSTIVTRTNEMDMIGLYKIFKPGFDEVFFVLSKSGTLFDQQINGEVCEYDNVLCVEAAEQVYTSDEELQAMVQHLTEKFFRRFGLFFDRLEKSVGSEQSAIQRIQNMSNKSPSEVKDKAMEVVNIANDSKSPRRLFYCGSSGSGTNRNYSTLGIYLVNAFFPEIVGENPKENTRSDKAALLLTLDSINDATPNDFLVYHMHQHCDVDVLTFPGLQLHINHPSFQALHELAYGKYSPPGKNIFVIGPHEEGPHSIQLPYAMMKWWVLVKGLGPLHGEVDQSTMEKLFIPSARPKNTKKHFLLYVNSHYVVYREMSAHNLSNIGPVHALGSCQGNLNAVPVVPTVSRPRRCQPYTDDERPPSIVVPADMNHMSNYFNRMTFQDFRFMLCMEDANLPGYITERIVEAFMSGTIPIYYGTTQVIDIFNPRAFIYYDINNPQEALDRIQYLENNPDAYDQMLKEPILANGEQTIEKYFSFDDSIGNGMLKKRVRSKLGLT